jgi:hypothetical protein
VAHAEARLALSSANFRRRFVSMDCRVEPGNDEVGALHGVRSL